LEVWHQKSIEWLEERNRRNPGDLAIMSWLVREHFTSKPRNCKRALTLYENLLQNKSVQGDHLDNLQTCYTELGKYDRALLFYERIAPLYKDENALAIRTQLAQIYMLKGDGQKAVVELEKCLQIAKGLPLPSFDRWGEGLRTRMRNEALAMKEQAIHHQEDLIKKVRAYFNLEKP
jgi:tetratricopeptide (TPR) repeat protein